MANQYVSLPVPAVDGVGAWVDTSLLAPGKVLSVDGGPFSGTIYIEGSNDNQVSAAPVDVLPFTSDAQAPANCVATLQFMRVRRSGTITTTAGAPTVRVSAELGTNIFGALAVPAGNGVGAAIDLSGGGNLNTFNVVGSLVGVEQLLIEISNDAGVTWSPALLFDSGGQVGRNYDGVIGQARVRRRISLGTTAPLVSVGSGDSEGSAVPTFAAPTQNWVQIVPGVANTAVRSDSRTTSFPSPDSFLVYCVDYDGLTLAGNDATANPGYAPSTGVPATDMTTALNAAKLTPFKTLERVGQLLQREGANSTPVVLVRTRTDGEAYRNIANTADQGMDYLNQFRGNKRLVVRGTLDFVNDLNDKIVCGFLAAAGTNAGGYNAIGGSSASLLVCQLNGGGAPAFPVEAAGQSAVSGLRIRFDAATATVALRNATSMVHQNDATNITPSDNLPAVPAVNDVFYLEEAGAAVGDFSHVLGTNISFNTAVTVAGIRAVTPALAGFIAGGSNIQYCGIWLASQLSLQRMNSTWFRTYNDEIGTSIALGLSVRAAGALISNVGFQMLVRSGFSAERFEGTRMASFRVEQGCFSRRGVQVIGSGNASPVATTIAGASIGNGGSATARRVRITQPGIGAGGAGILISACNGANIRGTDSTNQTGPLVRLENNAGALMVDDMTGTTGNTDVVLDVSPSAGALVKVGTLAANTATATLGDLRMAGGIVGPTFGNLAFTNYPDTNGNDVQGSIRRVCWNVTTLANASGGVLAAFTAVRGNGTTGQMVAAQGNTTPNSTGIAGILLHSTANGASGLVVSAGPVTCNFTGAATPGTMAKLSDTAGFVSSTAGTIDTSMGVIDVVIPASTLLIMNLIASPAPTGVLVISPGPGISITGTTTNPIVNNTGVLTVSAGTNVTITGTASDPIVNATTLRSVSIPFVYKELGALDGDQTWLYPASADNDTGVSEFLASQTTTQARIDCLITWTTTGAGTVTMQLMRNGVGTAVTVSQASPVTNAAQSSSAAITFTQSADSYGVVATSDNILSTVVSLRAVVHLANYT